MTTLARPALRPLAVADAGRVLELTRATGVFRDEEIAVADEVLAAALAARVSASSITEELPYYILGAELDHQLVGWICWGRTPCTQDTWDLYWLAVDPAAQGHGVGTALIEGMEQELAGARLVTINTSGRDDYEPTRRFYQSRGYPAVAVVADYYAPGDDLVIHVKRLGR
jgi:D-alanine-D-alanine ligase